MAAHEPPTMITRMSTKGQVVIPQALREAQGFSSGMKLKVEPLKGGGLALRPLNSVPHPITKLFGAFHRPGDKPLSVKDMDRLIMEHVAALDASTKSDAGHKKAAPTGKSSRKRRT